MIDLFAITQEAIDGLNHSLTEGQEELELVDVERAAKGMLVVTIDKISGVTIDDCEQVSRLLSHVFEVEDVDYNRLEVGSPGVDRPLKNRKDFIRFAGERVEIKLYEPQENNRKVFKGLLEVTAQEEGDEPQFSVTYEINKNESETLHFTFLDVEKAKLDPVLNFKGKKK